MPQIGVRLATMAILAIVLASSARAQVLNSGASTISLNAVTATTSWLLRPNIGSLKLYAFFATSTAALTDGAGNNIPSADFQISNNGGAFNALTNTVPFGGANAGLQLSSTPILGNNKSGTRTDQMNFNINLVPIPNLPAGTYTGTLTIQAQAI
jgi:hypothetical protein